jgi:hypothetical protein
MEQQDYDEVIAELYEKYKGKGHMAPELKLVLMIIGSAAMFTITKKITKMDSGLQGNMLSSLLGNVMSGQRSQAQPTMQQQAPQFRQQSSPQVNSFQEQLRQAHQMGQERVNQNQSHLGHGHGHGHGHQGQFRVPTLGPVPYGVNLNQMDNMSEDSDIQPSRMRGPEGNFDSPDSINLQDIMKTMAQNKRMKELEANKNKFELSFDEQTEDDIVKNVALKNKRGRPAKKNKGKGI